MESDLCQYKKRKKEKVLVLAGTLSLGIHYPLASCFVSVSTKTETRVAALNNVRDRTLNKTRPGKRFVSGLQTRSQAARMGELAT